MNERMLKEAEDLLKLAEQSAEREDLCARTQHRLRVVGLVALGTILTPFCIPSLFPESGLFVLISLPFSVIALIETIRFERKIYRKKLIHRLARAEAIEILREGFVPWISTHPTKRLKGIELFIRISEFDILNSETVRAQLNRVPQNS